MQKLLQNDQCHLNYFYIQCHACRLAHVPWCTCGGQGKTWGSWCWPPTMWVPGSNSGHQTWWQFPLSALRPTIMITKISMKCYFLQETLRQRPSVPRKLGHKAAGALALYMGHNLQGLPALNFYIFCLLTIPWFQGLNLRWPTSQASSIPRLHLTCEASSVPQFCTPELHPQTLDF